MFSENLEKAKIQLRGIISEKRYRKLETFYFGLFKQKGKNGEDQIITLEAIGDDMSEMNLTYDANNSETYKIFRILWSLNEKYIPKPNV